MNWLKRLFGGREQIGDHLWGVGAGPEGLPIVSYSDGSWSYIEQPRSAPDLPCGGTNRRHSWKPRGLSESSESCLRCGMAR